MTNSVRIVHQKPNHCVPACLESIFFDSDIGVNKKQDEIVQENPNIFNDGGAVIVNAPMRLGDVFKRYNIAVSCIYNGMNEKYGFDQLKAMALEHCNKILLMWRNGTQHCVRFVGIEPDDSIKVMDPQLDKDEYLVYTKTEQAQLNFGIICFTIKK